MRLLNIFIFYFIFDFKINCCCNCCCSNRLGFSKTNKKDLKPENCILKEQPDCIDSSEIKSYLNNDCTFGVNIEKEIKNTNDCLRMVQYLIENKLNCEKYLKKRFSFPHIHWNGSNPEKYKNLCYVLAPLNVILHLDCIKEFFKVDRKILNSVSSSVDLLSLISDVAFIKTYRIYVKMLEKGESFTLDPGKNFGFVDLLRINNKIFSDNDEALGVINVFFENSLKKFDGHPNVFCTSFNDKLGCDLLYLKQAKDFIRPDGKLDYGIFVDNFKEKINDGTCYDIIYFDFSQKLRTICGAKTVTGNGRDVTSDVWDNPIPITNIVGEFEYCGNKYVLKGLVFYSAGNDKLSYSAVNDWFSIVYDKNASDSGKPYVYCQLNRPLKYYSLEEIADGVNKLDGSEFLYKYNYLCYVFYEKL